MKVSVFENTKRATFSEGALGHAPLQDVKVLRHLVRHDTECPVDVSLFSFETSELALLEYVLSFRAPVVTVEGARPDLEPDSYNVTRFERGRVYVLLDNFLPWFDQDPTVQKARASLHPPLGNFDRMFTHGSSVSATEEKCAPKMYVSEKLSVTPRNYVWISPGIYVRADAFDTKLFGKVRNTDLGRLESSFPDVPDRHLLEE